MGTTDVDLSATYDWSSLYSNGPLTAVAKIAANYAWWVLGDQPVSRALSEQAFRFLEQGAGAAEFVAPTCSFDLLNRLGLSPPAHSLLVAPAESKGVYCVLVVLFGLVPYIVRTSPTAQRLDVVQAHRIGTRRDDSPVTNGGIFGSPKLDLASLWPEEDLARNRWIHQLALNVHEHLVTIGEENGFEGLSFEPILPDPKVGTNS